MTAVEKEFFQKLKFTAEEISARFENAHRDLSIAEKDPFAEVRFSYAFQSLIKIGIAVLASEGLKVRSIPGHHVKILERLSAALEDPDILTIGNAMRMKRNQDLYGTGQVISEKESTEYLAFVQKIFKHVRK